MYKSTKKSNSKNKIHYKLPRIIEKKETNYFDYIIANQNLMHFENLLINNLNAIKEKYEDRKNLSLFSLLLTVLLSIFGSSNDSIGFKIIKSFKAFNKINIETGIYFIVLFLLPTFLLYKTISFKRSLKGIDAEFLKVPTYQNKLLYKFIVIEHKNEIPIDIRDMDKFIDYYSDNITTIKFRKNDFEHYIHSYLYNKFKNKIGTDVSRYLAEVILSRNFLDHNIDRVQNDFYDFKFTLCINGLIFVCAAIYDANSKLK